VLYSRITINIKRKEAEGISVASGFGKKMMTYQGELSTGLTSDPSNTNL
jgi:hypothetical protein